LNRRTARKASTESNTSASIRPMRLAAVQLGYLIRVRGSRWTCTQLWKHIGQTADWDLLRRLSSTARATSLVASPVSWPSSSSTVRRSLWSAPRPSTSLASSSALSVRFLPPCSTTGLDPILVRPRHETLERLDALRRHDHTDTVPAVKYAAHLRKITRYNPTRGGESPIPSIRVARGCGRLTLASQVPSTSALPPESSTRPSVA
jgi:hypothetical protein